MCYTELLSHLLVQMLIGMTDVKKNIICSCVFSFVKKVEKGTTYFHDFSGVVNFSLSRQGKNIDKDNTPTEKFGVLESRELVLMFGTEGEEITRMQ